MGECDTPGCVYPAGHQSEHPCGQPIGTHCKWCGAPEPCEKCWTPVTPAHLKGLAAEAGKDVTMFDSMADLVRANAARYRGPRA